MRKITRHIILFFSLLMLSYGFAQAQPDFQTIVTQGPLVAGESFQVQYVLEETDKESEFFAPDFKGFGFVSGPNKYTGTVYGSGGTRKLKNIVYTLVAPRPGKYILPGAVAKVENRLIRSGHVKLEVISRAEAYKRTRQLDTRERNEDIFLRPGEDVYEKIQSNLFMKVQVDKKNCFVGEPVTAIFKLYSRLDSKSDIVKNPGFYGFTVLDVINLDNAQHRGDKQDHNETINGKEFDVHIVRKVQLYPLQAGSFTIDAMEVQNTIRFSKSAVNKKSEQEIIEGGGPDLAHIEDENATVVESSMSTEPVAITVKPTPPKNKPLDYSGATGNFKLAAWLRKNELAKNEESEFIITVSGKGNFTQLSPPVFKWPAGIEVFEPTVIDSLDYTQSPLRGKREFHFRFVSAKPGNYDLPAVTFSYFNPDTNNYKTISLQPENVKITKFDKPFEKVKARYIRTVGHNQYLVWSLALAIVLTTIIFFVVRGKRNKRIISMLPDKENIARLPTVAEIMQPANIFSAADDKTFYGILRNSILNFFTTHFDLTGSNMNKLSLSAAMQQKNIAEKNRVEILAILEQCDTGVFTNSDDAGDKHKLLEETTAVLEKIRDQIST